MKRHSIRIVLWILGLLVWTGFSGENKYLPEQPGKASVDVERVSLNQMTAAEKTAFLRNLEQLRDLIVALPVFHPTHGVEVTGWIRPSYTVPALAKSPKMGGGFIQYYPFVQDEKTGRIGPMIATTSEIRVSVNAPAGGLDSLGISGAQFFYDPKRTGEVCGFPLYRAEKGDEILVLSASGKVPWMPVTREEFINAWIRVWQEKASGPQDLFTQEIVDRHKAALAAMPAEERRMQAYYFPQARDAMGPPLAPAGTTEGIPVVKADPDWFDPSRPRSAFQLITLRFEYAGDVDPDNPALPSDGSPGALRVWETLHKSKWTAIAGALSR